MHGVEGPRGGPRRRYHRLRRPPSNASTDLRAPRAIESRWGHHRPYTNGRLDLTLAESHSPRVPIHRMSWLVHDARGSRNCPVAGDETYRPLAFAHRVSSGARAVDLTVLVGMPPVVGLPSPPA